jgi:hypothetical protein
VRCPRNSPMSPLAVGKLQYRCAGLSSCEFAASRLVQTREPATRIIVIDIAAIFDRSDAINNLSHLIEFKRQLSQEAEIGYARITSAICGSVNLILIVDFIGHAHLRNPFGGTSLIQPFSRFLVASQSVRDLLLCAKYLFWLARCRCGRGLRMSKRKACSANRLNLEC